MNSKALSVATSVIGLLSLVAGFFIPQVQGLLSAHPSVALVFFGVLKILNSFNSATPTSSSN